MNPKSLPTDVYFSMLDVDGNNKMIHLRQSFIHDLQSNISNEDISIQDVLLS